MIARHRGPALLFAAGLTVGGLLAVPATAGAASVTAAPMEAWTNVDTPLPFTGTDPVTGASRSLAVDVGGDDSTCVVNTPATNDYTGDCASVHFSVPPGMGAIAIDDSAVAYAGSGTSGGNVFTITGKTADLQASLASVVFTPAPGFTTDGQAPVQLFIAPSDTDGSNPDTHTVLIYVTDQPPATDAWFVHVPRHVYTPRGTQLDFAAAPPDPVTGEPRDITIDTPDDTDCTYEPIVMQGFGDCLVAFVGIAPIGTDDRGTLLVGVDTSGFAFTPLGVAGGFSVVGNEDQVQAVLASLSYVPPDPAFVTPPDDPVPVRVLLYSDSIPEHGAQALEIVPVLEHETYIYVHVVDLPPDCTTTTTTTPETTVPDDQPDPTTTTTTTTTTLPLLGDTTTTANDDTTTTTLPLLGDTTTTRPVLVIPSITFQLPTTTTIEVPAWRRPLGFRGAVAVRAVAAVPPAGPGCPPDTTTPGDDTPGGSLPATGASTAWPLGLAAVVAASGAALLGVRPRRRPH